MIFPVVEFPNVGRLSIEMADYGENEPLFLSEESAQAIVEILKNEGYDCRVIKVSNFDGAELDINFRFKDDEQY